MSALRRLPRRPVDGVLLLDKPVGVTSNGALMRVKRLYNAEKAGHTGTLDPLASGLLPICFGTATRFAQFLLDASKRYTAIVRFGVTTTTLDAEGDVVASRPVTFDRDALLGALARFTGSRTQIPPAHSALKFKGRPYYDYARKGVDFPRAPREITIHSLELTEWNAPDAILDVECSKGTYIRVLADELGEALGCGAHLAALRRTGSGGFGVRDAVSLDALHSMDAEALQRCLQSIDAPLASLQRLDVDVATSTALVQGRRPATTTHDGTYRVYESARFLGVAESIAGRLQVARLVPAPLASRESIASDADASHR